MPKAKDRYEEIKDERRQQILDCALELFSVNGFNATKIDDIAKCADISHGLLYHYFKTKEEIFVELFFNGNIIFDEMTKTLKQYEHLSAKQRFIILTDLMLEKLANDKRVSLQMSFRQNIELIKRDFKSTIDKAIANDTDGSLKKIFTDRQTHRHDFKELFESGLQEGTFRQGDPKELALFYWTILTGLTMQRLRETKKHMHAKSMPRELILRTFLKDGEIETV